jgi:hypothetical protein
VAAKRLEFLRQLVPTASRVRRANAHTTVLPRALMMRGVASFDYLVRTQHKAGRDLMTDCLRGLEIDH